MSEDTTTTEATTTEATTTPETDAPEQPKLKFGFAVLITEDGGVYVERNPSIFSVPVEREASLIEVRRYTSEILMDLQAQSAAEYVTLKMAVQQPNA